MRYLAMLGVFVVATLLVFSQVVESAGTPISEPVTLVASSETGISSGLPTVTPDAFIAKINSTTDALYDAAKEVIPGITIMSLILGAITMIILWDFRVRIGAIILGLIVVLWAPQIIDFIVDIVQF